MILFFINLGAIGNWESLRLLGGFWWSATVTYGKMSHSGVEVTGAFAEWPYIVVDSWKYSCTGYLTVKRNPYLGCTSINQSITYLYVYVGLLSNHEVSLGTHWRVSGHNHSRSPTPPQYWKRYLVTYLLLLVCWKLHRYKNNQQPPPPPNAYEFLGRSKLPKRLVFINLGNPQLPGKKIVLRKKQTKENYLQIQTDCLPMKKP